MLRSNLGRIGLLLICALGLMALFASGAVASGPPIVSISPTTEHSLHTVVANGTVDKNGANTTYKFEYGKTKLYGHSTTSQNATEAGAVPVSATIAGLEPMTTYHVRISATNSFGTTVSEDLIFEMLLQWKIEGKTLAEFSEKPVPYESIRGIATFLVEGTTKGGTKTKITCESNNFTEGQAVGQFGVKYHQQFANCKTFLNEKESRACEPKTPFNLDLNSVMVPAATDNLELGLECSIGETISLTKGGAGFEIGATPEAKIQRLTLTERVPFNGFKATFQTQELGVVAGQFPFGIS